MSRIETDLHFGNADRGGLQFLLQSLRSLYVNLEAL